jgi:hypothetical protein
MSPPFSDTSSTHGVLNDTGDDADLTEGYLTTQVAVSSCTYPNIGSSYSGTSSITDQKRLEQRPTLFIVSTSQ